MSARNIDLRDLGLVLSGPDLWLSNSSLSSALGATLTVHVLPPVALVTLGLDAVCGTVPATRTDIIGAIRAIADLRRVTMEQYARGLKDYVGQIDRLAQEKPE